MKETAARPTADTQRNKNKNKKDTQGAAYALMGKAYLYWADLKGDDPALFQSAADAFQSIVDLGAYQLQDDMQELFVFDNRNTPESVFEIQHNPLWSSDWGWFEGVGQRQL